jgi:hypothetical protein
MGTPFWVIDTNVFVSAAITPGGICDQVLQCAVAGLFVPVWDNQILSEYREVLARPKFKLSKTSPKFRKNLKKIAPIWQFCDQKFCKPFIINDRVFQLSFVVPKNIKFFLTLIFFFVICCVHVF